MLSGKINDITGKKFGSLTVLEYAGVSKGKARIALWKCKCDCGVEKTFYGTALRSGGTSSCGCLKGENISNATSTHGMTKSRTYKTWVAMRNRCCEETSPDFPQYGGRGIEVCERWLNSFENFLEDMGERPLRMSIDRIDTNGNYEKSNCKWSTDKEQARNRRNNVFIEWGCELMTIAEFAELIGKDHSYVRYRLSIKGMTPSEIVAEGCLVA